ncbi:hypothetical protein Tco_1546163 [Tanacetum coccineum]
MDREVKRLKQSRIPIVKVRWNSKRDPEFTWESKDQFRSKLWIYGVGRLWTLGIGLESVEGKNSKKIRRNRDLTSQDIHDEEKLYAEMEDRDMTMQEYVQYETKKALRNGFSSKHTVSSRHVNEINLKNETSLSKNNEEEYNVISYNDLFPFNIISVNDSKLDTDSDDDKIGAHCLGPGPWRRAWLALKDAWGQGVPTDIHFLKNYFGFLIINTGTY